MKPLESLTKILLGVGLAVLVFMSWMLAEQRGWVNTDISGTILNKIDDGKAVKKAQDEAKKEAEKAKTQAAENEPAETVKETPAPAPVKTDDPADDFSDSSNNEEPSASDDEPATTDDDEPAETSEETPEPAKTEPAKKSSKKFSYADVARRPGTWPNAVIVTAKGTKIPLLDASGNKIGETNLPVGRRLYVKKLSASGVLTVEAPEIRQVFEIHASRTNFRKIYTEKPSVSIPAPAKSDDTSSGDDSADEDDSDDSGSKSSGSSSGDNDFFDDDF